MCSMFVYKSAPNVFGISRSGARPSLPNLKEEWCLHKAMRGQGAKCSGDGSDESMIFEIMKSLDNDTFFQIMEFLEEEGYTVNYPNASSNLSNEE